MAQHELGTVHPSEDQAIYKLAFSCIELENGKCMVRRSLVISIYLSCAQVQNVLEIN
jgi:hypothetical protein